MKTVFLVILFFSVNSLADILSGHSQLPVSYSDFLSSVKPGTILIIGESHAQKDQVNPDQLTQVKVIEDLLARGLAVNVGMEFVAYTFQNSLDRYLLNAISEKEFKKEISWGGSPFGAYRSQILLPGSLGYHTFGLNLERRISRKIFRSGLGALEPHERKLLPPDFTLGNAHYKKRFKEIMGDHGDPGFLERAFVAQSAWDDTMAMVVSNNTPTDEVLVIIVGNFHMRYEDGLVDRIRARSDRPILSLLQTENTGISAEAKILLSQAHPEYGTIADFIW